MRSVLPEGLVRVCTWGSPDSAMTQEAATASSMDTSPSTPPATVTIAPPGAASSALSGIVARSPVAEISMPALGAASSSEATANPSIDACRARTGSSSTTVTRAPSAAPKRAQPRPTSP